MSSNVSRGKRGRGGKGGSSQMGAVNLSTISLSPATDRKLITQAAVKLSLTEGAFVDTKFYAFSRKTSSGMVDKPVALYANSAVLKVSSKYFEGLLTGGYRENKLSPLDAPFPADLKDHTSEYDYISDSDLDEYDDVEGDDDDDESEDAVDQFTPAAIDNLQLTDGSTDKVMLTIASDEPTGRCGNVVLLPDVAFQTLRALLFYLYTGEIKFTPLRSQKIDAPNQPALAYQPHMCSPKSMYRIADKYGLSELKQKAADDLQSKLSSTNILPELFSTITSTYEEVRTAQVAYACGQGVYPSVVQGVPAWIARFSTGELQHCETVVTALLKKMADNLTAAHASVAASTAAEERTTPPKCYLCHRQLAQSISCTYCRVNTTVYS